MKQTIHGQELEISPGANLTGANLSKANLSWASLTDANLSEANLSWANLTDANLSKASLSKARLFNANLSWANLTGANLSKANLSWANLTDANLSKADLFGANLTDANLSEAGLFNTNLSGANLTGANLGGADLSGAQGLLNPSDWLDKNFKWDTSGITVYKSEVGFRVHPQYWVFESGRFLTETPNCNRTDTCGCGVNFATAQWVRTNLAGPYWECRIHWIDLAGVVVPYNTDGKARCGRMELLRMVSL